MFVDVHLSAIAPNLGRIVLWSTKFGARCHGRRMARTALTHQSCLARLAVSDTMSGLRTFPYWT